ncbi:MAG: hypothetical protein M3209_09585 [Acidobacteriota bacterium]|nr:hypothetical protein [Acidobacteriota bacterium]
MPDIAMCSRDDCPMKRNCYRYRAVPTPNWQTYAFFEPESENECDGFMQIRDGTRTRTMTEIADERKRN